jgi:predicted enzyme related to lactoylglutathione lyase
MMGMKCVTGIGGIFFKSKDPEKLKSWYEAHLGIKAEKDGTMFEWRDKENPDRVGYTVWSVFPHATKYFDPGRSPFMINYRVANLKELIKTLQQEGVTMVGGIKEYEYGKFAWILDPDGNKIELWEPPEGS